MKRNSLTRFIGLASMCCFSAINSYASVSPKSELKLVDDTVKNFNQTQLLRFNP